MCTRFMPDQSTHHSPETCDLSWASGSFARNLTETPEKRHSLSVEILKPVEGKLASQPCTIFISHGGPLSGNEASSEGH